MLRRLPGAQGLGLGARAILHARVPRIEVLGFWVDLLADLLTEFEEAEEK